jgi:copper(I)-binding protein
MTRLILRTLTLSQRQTTTGRRQFMQAATLLAAPWLSTPARACEFFTTTLRVTHPWTRVTPQEAPFAVVIMKIDEVRRDDRLIGVRTPVATRAELVGLSDAVRGGMSSPSALSLPIPRGETLQFDEGGLHVRLFGLTQPLLMARTYPMSLVFEHGGELEAELNVDYEAG